MNFLHKSIARHLQKRFYDTKQFKLQKKIAKASRNQEDVPFSDALSTLSMYSLGIPSLLRGHVQLGPLESTRPIRGQVDLPHPLAAQKAPLILVFAKGAQAQEAKALGAHIVGGEELIPEILDAKLDFNTCLATKSMFPHVIKIAKFLGPKGLMPSPAKGTVSDSIADMMASVKSLTKFEMDANRLVSLDWNPDQIWDNLEAVVRSVVDVKPSKMDFSKFIESVSLSAPYTPAIRLPLKPFRPKVANKD